MSIDYVKIGIFLKCLKSNREVYVTCTRTCFRTRSISFRESCSIKYSIHIKIYIKLWSIFFSIMHCKSYAFSFKSATSLTYERGTLSYGAMSSYTVEPSLQTTHHPTQPPKIYVEGPIPKLKFLDVSFIPTILQHTLMQPGTNYLQQQQSQESVMAARSPILYAQQQHRYSTLQQQHQTLHTRNGISSDLGSRVHMLQSEETSGSRVVAAASPRNKENGSQSSAENRGGEGESL